MCGKNHVNANACLFAAAEPSYDPALTSVEILQKVKVAIEDRTTPTNMGFPKLKFQFLRD